MAQAQQKPPEGKILSFKEFLEEVPSGREVSVKNIRGNVLNASRREYLINLPVLELHCAANSCGGTRLFGAIGELHVRLGFRDHAFVWFKCRNCEDTRKTYALRIIIDALDDSGKVYKFGETPQFGPPTPPRVISLIREEMDYYLKGRRAENQGMGIGAFAYYRRVVENQKDKILDEIIRVAGKIGASEKMLAHLNAAKKERQFTTAVRNVKNGIPPALLVNGHNPLTLLHNALSEGLHTQTDEQCLKRATHIRVILTELIDRVAIAMKDDAEVNAAVSTLLNAKTSKPETSN